MRQRWSEAFKGWIRPLWYKTFHPGQPAYECPICGYRGPFKDKRISRTPDVVREAAKCVKCGAVERHRIQYLIMDAVLSDWGARQKRILHIAPEFCLQPRLAELFGVYHTADLFRSDVDFKEDIQKMSFPDASYDCVFVSRVLTDIENLEAGIREMRRIVKSGGLVFISEGYLRNQTEEYAERRGERARALGLDVWELYRRHFASVECYRSDRFDPKYQLMNRLRVAGKPDDAFPADVRTPGIGYMELVAVCRA